MTSPELPEPESNRAAPPAGDAVRRSQVAWAAVAVALLVVVVVGVASRRDDAVEPDIQIGLPLPQQVLMGGQTSTLGSDPDRGVEANVWLNVSGPGSSTSNGDLFHAGTASGTTTGTGPPSQTTGNDSYDPAGHLFAVTVHEVEAGASLVIDAFDPAWVHVGDSCEREGQTGSGSSVGPPEATPRCTGDQYLGSGGNPATDAVTTTYLVRGPDATPADSTDNPVVCASTYAGWPSGPGGGPAPGVPDGVITDPTYQAWDGLCRIPPGDVRPGSYLVQVRTNADLGSPRWGVDATLAGDAGSLVDADPAATGAGANRFALRAGWGDDEPSQDRGVTIQALDHLSIYVNRTDASAAFSLVRVPTSAAGRSLHLGFWDLGDVSGGSGLVLTVGTPAGARSAADPAAPVAVGCEVMTERTVGPMIEVDGCTIGGITASTFNASMLDVRVLIPADYRCDAADDCWLPLRLGYPGARPNDTTTWRAEWEQDGSTPRESPVDVPGTDPPPGTVRTTLAPPSTTTTTPAPSTSTTPTSTTSTSTTPTSTTSTSAAPEQAVPPGTVRPGDPRSSGTAPRPGS